MKINLSDAELSEVERLVDGLIRWMFHSPNNREPLRQTIKEAIMVGKKFKRAKA